MGRTKPKHELRERIAGVLEKSCPAFKRDPDGGPATWHQCFCLAQEKPDAHCTCVWHKKSSCQFGKWPEVEEVISPVREHRENKAAQYQRAVAERQSEIHNEETE